MASIAVAAEKPRGVERYDWNGYWKRIAKRLRGDSSIDFLHRRSFDYAVGGKDIVQLGCGDMQDIPQFHMARYVGIDISSKAIEMAKETVKDLPKDNSYRFIAGADFTKEIPLENRSADVVIAIETLHLAGSALPFVVQEVGRVLRPGGVFQFDMIHPETQILSGVEHVKVEYGTLFHMKDGNVITCTEEEIVDLLMGAGLKVRELQVWGDNTLGYCMNMQHRMVFPDVGLCFPDDKKFVSLVRALRK